MADGVDVDGPVRHVADEHGLDVDALRKAAQETARELLDLIGDFANALPAQDDLGILLTGSLARKELTSDSDADYLVVIVGTPSHEAIANVMAEADSQIAERFSEPGRQGVFGDFAFAIELLARIGLQSDTNVNTTRRLLVLFESVSVFGEPARTKLIEQLLERYCHDYHPSIRRDDDPVAVPRFLLNDLMRYWRTMAVDFGAKRWRSLRKDWFLRYAKLLTTRKILFAGSLMSLLIVGHRVTGADAAARYDALLAFLRDQCELSPLARLLEGYDLMNDESKAAAATLLDSYNAFIEILDLRSTRNKLKAVVEPAKNEVATEIEALAGRIQSSLETVFFDDPAFAPATRRYGLF